MAGSMRLWKDRFSHSSHANILCKARRDRAKLIEDVPELAAVKTQRPITADDEHRVLEFRPRTSTHPPGQRAGSGEQVALGGPSRDPPDSILNGRGLWRARAAKGRKERLAGGERSGALRARPGAAGRFPPSHAGKPRRLRVHRGTDGRRVVAGNEHRGSAPDPGLCADGTARLRTYFRPEYLTFSGQTGPPGAQIRSACRACLH